MMHNAKLDQVRTAICHANCPDGLASAMILKHALPNVTVRFIQYGPELDALEPSPGMIFCDITPTHACLRHIELGTIVLDHHWTARPVVELFAECGLGVFADETTEPGVSGALLAYRHVTLDLVSARTLGLFLEQVERFATLAGVRDTWQRQHPDWETACNQADALMFLGPELLLQRLDPYLRTADMQLGALVRNKRERRARETAEQGLLVVGRIGIFNDGERLISDIAEARRELQHRQIERGVFGLEVLAGFHYVPDAGGGLRLVVSFRSLGAVDVAAIAKANGGGGHTLAAGFTLASASGPLGCILHALTLAGRGDLLLE